MGVHASAELDGVENFLSWHAARPVLAAFISIWRSFDNGVEPERAKVIQPPVFGVEFWLCAKIHITCMRGSVGCSDVTDLNDCWRIGVLFSQTGPTALAERALLNGTRFAIEEVNKAGGVRGKPIIAVEMDPASDEARYRDFSRVITEEMGISVVFGGYTSAGRKAMIPNIERTDSLLFYPTFYEGFEYSDHVFYFGSCPNQYIVQLVDHMIQKFGGSFFLVGANYVFPRESNRIIKELLSQAGGRVLGERYLPLDSTAKQAEAVVRDIVKAKPDVVFSILVGDQILDFYSAFHRTDLRKAGVPIASIVTTETEIDRMGHDIALGHYCAASFFDTVESSGSKRFVDNFQQRFGESFRANSSAEAAYNQVMVFADALERCGTISTPALREAVLGTQFAAPQGDIRVDAENHHTYLWSRIGVVDAAGKIEIVYNSPRSVPPDPYLINHDIKHPPTQASRKLSFGLD